MEEFRSDAEILARASGQPEIFSAVFDRHFATIHRYLERRVGRDGADELAGDVFRVAFEQRARFRPVHESALPWLYGIATNLALKRRRGESRRLQAHARLGNGGPPVDEGFEVAEERIAALASRDRLLEALAGLSRDERDVVVLVAWEELTYEEVAAALDIPLGTVRSRLSRARRRFRELLEASESEPAIALTDETRRNRR